MDDFEDIHVHMGKSGRRNYERDAEADRKNNNSNNNNNNNDNNNNNNYDDASGMFGSVPIFANAGRGPGAGPSRGAGVYHDNIFADDDVQFEDYEDVSEFGRRLNDEEDYNSCRFSDDSSDLLDRSQGNDGRDKNRKNSGKGAGKGKGKKANAATANIVNDAGADQFIKYRELCGHQIEYDPVEVKDLEALREMLEKTMKKGGEFGNQELIDGFNGGMGDQGMNRIIECGKKNRKGPLNNCYICEYATMVTADANKGATNNAVMQAMDYDQRFYGYMPDEVLYRHLAHIFNFEQAKVYKQGGKAFLVTVSMVAEHMRHHTISNPMRPIGTQLVFCGQMIDKLTHMVLQEREDNESDNDEDDQDRHRLRTPKKKRRVALNFGVYKILKETMQMQIQLNDRFQTYRALANHAYETGQNGFILRRPATTTKNNHSSKVSRPIK